MEQVLQSGATFLQSGKLLQRRPTQLRDTRMNAHPCLLIGSMRFDSGVV